MTTRLYLQNSAAGYTPATKRGAWDDATSTVVKKLGKTKLGSSAISVKSETSPSNTWDVLLARFVTEPLQSNTPFTTSDTVKWVMGVLESSPSADFVFHVHIFITKGNTDSLRGTLLNDIIASAEWPTAPARGHGNVTRALSTVSALVGDRIVVEVGYRAKNNRTTSFSGTLYYGATGLDLSPGSAAVITNPGWVEFSKTFAIGILDRNIGLSPASMSAMIKN